MLFRSSRVTSFNILTRSSTEKQVLEFLTDTTLLTDDGIIIVEASKKTDLSYAEELGYSIIKEKMYKTNKHIFLEKE